MDLTAHEELVEFLAQLDFVVESRTVPWSLQDPNQDEHIQKDVARIVETMHHPYTVDYVRSRLLHEFQHSYTFADYNFPSLILHGSYEMTTLDQNTRNLVRERVNQIRLQQTFRTEQRSRRLRSVYAAPATTSTQNRRKHPKLAQQPQRSGEKKKFSAKHQKRTRDTDSMRIKVPMRSKSKIRKRTTEPQGAVACDTIEETPSDQSFISESQQDIAAASLLSNDTLAQRKYMSHNADPRYNDNSSLESREVASKIPGETILAEDQEDMVFELAQYKHRCQKAEQECANLKKELRQMQSDYAQANGLQEKILMQLRSRTQLNIKQQNQLNDKKDLEPYLAIGKAWDNMPTIRKLLVDYKDMKEKLSSVLLFNEERPISAETLYGRSDDLDLLLRTVLHIDEQEKATNTLKIAPTFKIRECIQALTGAAIKIWVFESTYKSISMMVTPVLKHYRSQVASLWSEEGLCNLDMAAHQAVIQDEDFKEETVTRMASRTTKRLLNALRFLAGQQDSDATFQNVESQLESVLSLAVHIRSLSLISSADFELIWPSPGVSFVENGMTTEPSMSMGAKGAGLVKVPILPGLRIYTLEKAMIQYHGFGRRVATSRTPDYTIKAVVIVEDET